MYVRFGQQSSTPITPELREAQRERPFLRFISLEPMESYGSDSYEGINLPPVRQKSLATYEKYTRIPKDVCNGPSFRDYDIFQKYVSFGCNGEL